MSLWSWIRDEHNRNALAFVGAGVAAVTVAGWSAFVYFDSQHSNRESTRSSTLVFDSVIAAALSQKIAESWSYSTSLEREDIPSAVKFTYVVEPIKADPCSVRWTRTIFYPEDEITLDEGRIALTGSGVITVTIDFSKSLSFSIDEFGGVVVNSAIEVQGLVLLSETGHPRAIDSISLGIEADGSRIPGYEAAKELLELCSER